MNYARACRGRAPRGHAPLTLDDVDGDLSESFDYTTVGAAWIRENEGRFTPYVPRVPDIPATYGSAPCALW